MSFIESKHAAVFPGVHSAVTVMHKHLYNTHMYLQLTHQFYYTHTHSGTDNLFYYFRLLSLTCHSHSSSSAVFLRIPPNDPIRTPRFSVFFFTYSFFVFLVCSLV